MTIHVSYLILKEIVIKWSLEKMLIFSSSSLTLFLGLISFLLVCSAQAGKYNSRLNAFKADNEMVWKGFASCNSISITNTI